MMETVTTVRVIVISIVIREVQMGEEHLTNWSDKGCTWLH